MSFSFKIEICKKSGITIFSQRELILALLRVVAVLERKIHKTVHCSQIALKFFFEQSVIAKKIHWEKRGFI